MSVVLKYEQASEFPGWLVIARTAGPAPRIHKSTGLGGTLEVGFLMCFPMMLMLLVWETTPSEPLNQSCQIESLQLCLPHLF